MARASTTSNGCGAYGEATCRAEPDIRDSVCQSLFPYGYRLETLEFYFQSWIRGFRDRFERTRAVAGNRFWVCLSGLGDTQELRPFFVYTVCWRACCLPTSSTAIQHDGE